MKTVAIIGSTGSIGQTTLDVINKYKKFFKIIFLCADKNYKKLNYQSIVFKPKFISLQNKNFLKKLKPKIKVLNSIEDIIKLKKKIDFIISAVSGYSALDLNFKLLSITRNLLIANKETIICGGNFFLNQAKKKNCKVIPIDSEHFCINYFLNNFKNKEQVRNFYLTASGGPFLKKKPINNISIKEVINHPNWKMGKKISVNSANMTNKIMELYEAHVLFKIKLSNLKIKIEKSSKIHSIISLNNGLDFLISHIPNMNISIENSLIKKKYTSDKFINVSNFSKFNFEFLDPNPKVFPVIKTGFKALNLGHRAMIIFTVLNDRLVDLFLKKKIKFNYIANTLIRIFKKFKIVNYSKKDIKTFTDIKDTIKFANTIEI